MPRKSAWVAEIESTLADLFGATVVVNYGKRKSRILLECGPREDFERVYELLKSAFTGRP